MVPSKVLTCHRILAPQKMTSGVKGYRCIVIWYREQERRRTQLDGCYERGPTARREDLPREGNQASQFLFFLSLFFFLSKIQNKTYRQVGMKV